MSSQDMLTDELVGMAAGMKSNTLAMEGQLRQRATLLDDTEEAMEHSLQQARKGKQRAKEIHSRWALLLLRWTTMVVLLVRVTGELHRRGAALLNFHKCQRSNISCCSLHSSMNASHTCVEFHHQARVVSTAQAETSAPSLQESHRLLQDVPRAAARSLCLPRNVRIYQGYVHDWFQAVAANSQVCAFRSR